jgi:hypothetical protein
MAAALTPVEQLEQQLVMKRQEIDQLIAHNKMKETLMIQSELERAKVWERLEEERAKGQPSIPLTTLEQLLIEKEEATGAAMIAKDEAKAKVQSKMEEWNQIYVCTLL